nr:carotenoid isomerooxygenase-like [Cherax quadricarinatus]
MPYDFSTWDRNCLEEQVIPIDGTVKGTVPPWLRGSYLLDGPGRMTYGENEFNHVFDGSALLQKFTFGETGVSFASRFLRSYAYTTNLEHKQIVVSEFGTTGKSIAKSALSKLGDKFAFDKMFSDNAPVGVVIFGGEYYCTTEAPFLHKINPNTLETISKVDLHKELGINSQCPNPRTLADGTTLNILHGVGATGPKYDIMTFPATPLEGKSSVFAKPKKIGSVDARWKLNPCHMHSFGLTENYLVLLEQPLTIDVRAMVANTIREKPFIGGMEWLENKLVKIHLVSRETGKEVKLKIKCESFFFMHIINSYEKDNHVIIDVNAYKKPDLLHAFHLKNLRVGYSEHAHVYVCVCVCVCVACALACACERVYGPVLELVLYHRILPLTFMRKSSVFIRLVNFVLSQTLTCSGLSPSCFICRVSHSLFKTKTRLLDYGDTSHTLC